MIQISEGLDVTRAEKLRGFPVLIDGSVWVEGAMTARACLRSGVNVPFGDVLVFASATRHGFGLLERDRHSAMIAEAMEKCTPAPMIVTL